MSAESCRRRVWKARPLETVAHFCGKVFESLFGHIEQGALTSGRTLLVGRDATRLASRPLGGFRRPEFLAGTSQTYAFMDDDGVPCVLGAIPDLANCVASKGSLDASAPHFRLRASSLTA
jgi:hypothetical protein